MDVTVLCWWGEFSHTLVGHGGQVCLRDMPSECVCKSVVSWSRAAEVPSFFVLDTCSTVNYGTYCYGIS